MSICRSLVLCGLTVVAVSCGGSDEQQVILTDEQIERIRQADVASVADQLEARDLERPPPVTAAPRETRSADDPPTAAELDVELDAAGRPYDVELAWYEGSALVTEEIGTLHIADGELRIMNGSTLEVQPVDPLPGEAGEVTFDVDELTLTMLFAGLPPTDERPVRRSTVGVRLDVPDGDAVAEWQPYEFAYGTDGGVGGLTSGAIVDGAADQVPYSEGGDFFVEWDYTAEYYFGTHASTKGPDVFIFGNGFGDGAFPMSLGVDADGRLVSLLLPTLTYPWRRMVTDGQPPADVTEREDQLVECMNGERPATVDGTCLADGER